VAFTAQITPEGQVLVSPEVAERLRAFAGSVVAVRVTDEPLSAALKARGIADEEVDRIASAQLVSRETAARFLLIEGALRPGRGRRARR